MVNILIQRAPNGAINLNWEGTNDRALILGLLASAQGILFAEMAKEAIQAADRPKLVVPDFELPDKIVG